MPVVPAGARALALACGLALAASAPGRADDITVATDAGALIGRQADGVSSFLGIPYAAPPVGPLRFRPPRPHAVWTGPREANDYGSPCPQSGRLGSPSDNEDCLYLNVWAEPGASKRPVLVFIHGGSFNAGSGGATQGGPDYAGADIARRGHAVVVTLNYRLGILGYLAAPALDAENIKSVSGNYGLQDQQAALRWVRDNIAAFGGDPGNVTLFGESAGGISVLYQLTSPGGAGLFQRAIVESANDGASLFLAAAETAEAPVIAALGCGATPDVAGCLRGLPVSAFIGPGLNAGPLIDGVTVPQPPTAAFVAGDFNKVPVTIGTNANEGTYFIAVASRAAGRALTEADVLRTVSVRFGAAAPAILAVYPVALYPQPADALAAVETDSFFACPSEHVRSLLTAYVPVRGYEFAQPSPARNFPLPTARGIDLGDSHTTELAYVFGHDGVGAPLTGADAGLATTVIDDWSGAADPGWPLYDNGTSALLSLRAEPATTTDFAARHHCALWQSLGYPEVLITSLPPG